MSAFAEFFLIAFAIYLWESCLWLPLRTVVLRRAFSGKRWNTVRPGHWMATKESGLVPMLPLLPDTGLAPCQSPPLLVDAGGGILVLRAGAEAVPVEIAGWEDVREEFPKLRVGPATMRISSPRALEVLRRAKKRGDSPAKAVRKWWRMGLSPARARREWRRWQRVSTPLEILCMFLTTGFFVALPMTFVYSGILPALAVAAVLWLLMIAIAARLWWMAAKVYPGVKSQLRMDAMLSLFVPFHAMRSFELASVHAMAGIHPAALILSSGETGNPWLAGKIRELLHPRPGVEQDRAEILMMLPSIGNALARVGKRAADYDTPPSREDDPEAISYCPRCHAVFGKDVPECPDCRGIAVRAFA